MYGPTGVVGKFNENRERYEKLEGKNEEKNFAELLKDLLGETPA